MFFIFFSFGLIKIFVKFLRFIFHSRSISFGDEIKRARSSSIKLLTRSEPLVFKIKQAVPKYRPSYNAVEYMPTCHRDFAKISYKSARLSEITTPAFLSSVK